MNLSVSTMSRIHHYEYQYYVSGRRYRLDCGHYTLDCGHDKPDIARHRYYGQNIGY